MIKHVHIALLLALVTAPAIAAKPTSADIAAARGECRYERQKVAALEAGGKASEADLKWERSAWDRACAYAEHLMVEAGLEKPSAAPVAVQPVPQIVITERKSPGGEFASVPVSSAAPMATPAPAQVAAPTLQLKQWRTDELVISEPVRSESPSDK